MSLDLASTLQQLPPPWPYDLLPTIRATLQARAQSLIVLDDDPTGTQTVYDLPVLTEWSVDVLIAEMRRGTPVFYVLTNSRSLAPADAAALNVTIGRNIAAASAQTGRDVAVVSRSDSTLRGHFPIETDALATGLGTHVDGLLLIPYFLEGGRFTIDDVHYVAEGEQLVPAAETPFAADPSFGYSASNLRAWVEEKTQRRVAAEDVDAISLHELREGGPVQVAAHLRSLESGRVCVVNGVCGRDMEVLVAGLLAAEADGKRFLYRTAASFVQARAGLAPKPLLTARELALPQDGGALTVVGSYVPKSSAQLDDFLQNAEVQAVVVHVAALLDARTRTQEIARARDAVDDALRRGHDVVLYTSRELIKGEDAADSLRIGRQVSASLVAIVAGLTVRPRYVLAKGGITSSDLATRALTMTRAWVMGQILPGVPVWRAGDESKLPGLCYIVFPGNVGDVDALDQVRRRLAAA